MNYAEARMLESKSGWHFTVRNDDDIWTHECCRTQVLAGLDDVQRYEALGLKLTPEDLVPGPPHDPHPTREEAEACFNRWRREQQVDLDAEWSNWQGCEVCDAPTKKAARVKDIAGPRYHSLCDEHRTVEQVRELTADIATAVYS